jgi:hypothetical protein
MAEWGVRLEVPGRKAEEFKVKTGKGWAQDYAAFVNGSAVSLMTGEKATVVTRASDGDPWKVPGGK